MNAPNNDYLDSDDDDPIYSYNEDNGEQYKTNNANVIPHDKVPMDNNIITPLSPENRYSTGVDQRSAKYAYKKYTKPIVISPPIRTPKIQAAIQKTVQPKVTPPKSPPIRIKSPAYARMEQAIEEPHISLPKQYIPMATDLRHVHNPIHDMKMDFQIPPYVDMSEEQREDRLTDFRVKFNTLRKTYPDIPLVVDDLNPTYLRKLFVRYRRYYKQLNIDYSAEQYKVGLIFYFVGLELIATKFFGLNADKFTVNQIKWIPIYQQSLNELCEEHPGGVSTGWPPMVKLVVYGMVNLVLFVVLNHFMAKLGPGITDKIQNAVFNLFAHGNMTGQQPSSNIDAGPNGELPPPPEDNGMFSNLDFGSLLSGLSGMMGNNNKPAAAEKEPRRGPRYSD